jgi:hypothetical protein
MKAARISLPAVISALAGTLAVTPDAYAANRYIKV